MSYGSGRSQAWGGDPSQSKLAATAPEWNGNLLDSQLDEAASRLDQLLPPSSASPPSWLDPKAQAFTSSRLSAMRSHVGLQASAAPFQVSTPSPTPPAPSPTPRAPSPTPPASSRLANLHSQQLSHHAEPFEVRRPDVRADQDHGPNIIANAQGPFAGKQAAFLRQAGGGNSMGVAGVRGGGAQGNNAMGFGAPHVRGPVPSAFAAMGAMPSARGRGGQRGGGAGGGGRGQFRRRQQNLGALSSAQLVEELHRRHDAALQRPNIDNSMHANSPLAVGEYQQLLPLHNAHSPQLSASLGVWAFAFKAISARDNKCYVLTCIPPYHSSSPPTPSPHQPQQPHSHHTDGMFLPPVSQWSRSLSSLSHPALVSLHTVFHGDYRASTALYLVHTYHPNSQTLGQKFGLTGQGYTPAPPPPEDTLWLLIVQIIGALNTLHNASVPSCMVDINKILVTGQNRFRLLGTGTADILGLHALHTSREHAMANDLRCLGRVVLQLANMLPVLPTNLATPLEGLSRNYSTQLHEFVSSRLLSKPSGGPLPTACDLYACPVLGSKAWMLAEAGLSHADLTEGLLQRELDNGRIARLLLKLQTILEHPVLSAHPAYRETGEKYLISLFRNHVFHQLDEEGKPIVDFAHMVACLNKLDEGSREKVMLVSPDERTMVVTSYAEVKRCVADALQDLRDLGRGVEPGSQAAPRGRGALGMGMGMGMDPLQHDLLLAQPGMGAMAPQGMAQRGVMAHRGGMGHRGGMVGGGGGRGMRPGAPAWTPGQ